MGRVAWQALCWLTSRGISYCTGSCRPCFRAGVARGWLTLAQAAPELVFERPAHLLRAEHFIVAAGIAALCSVLSGVFCPDVQTPNIQESEGPDNEERNQRRMTL